MQSQYLYYQEVPMYEVFKEILVPDPGTFS